MGIANVLKGIAMLGRFAPKPLATLALFIIILQCLYSKQAIAKPRPKQYFNKQQWTGDKHWTDLSLERSVSERDKRKAVDVDDSLEGQKGFKVLTASNDKREGIQTPIEALKTESLPLETSHEQNSRSNVNQPSGGSTTIVRQNSENISQQKSATSSSQNEHGETINGFGGNKDGDIAGEKRGDVSVTSANSQKASKTQSSDVENNSDTKQDSSSSSTPVASNKNNSDKSKSDSSQSVNNSPKPVAQDSPSSVNILGNTINGKPIDSSVSNPDPVKDSLGNSGSEVVTTQHSLYEDQSANYRFPYRDARSKDGGAKESTEPEVGHFQVDDKSADLEINANSAGVKVKAKPASLQVVSRPGAHPPTPIIPVAPMHPYYHHRHHYHPYFDAYRRSMKPYHRRLYHNPYHAHYRAWVPPPGHHFRPYFEDPEDAPFNRRTFNPYGFGFRHRHHRNHRYPEPDLYDRSDVEDMYDNPIYRRRFRGPYGRRMYRRRRFGYFNMPESRFHIPRRPRPFVRHDIVTPVPPPVNVYGNPPPGVLNGEAANLMGMNGMGRMYGMGRINGMERMNGFNEMPNMGGYGMGGPGMNGPLMPGMNGPAMNGPAMNGPAMNGPEMNGPAMNGPGLNGFSMNEPGMFGTMGMNEGLGGEDHFNDITRSLGPRNINPEPSFHVKKTSIQGLHKKKHVKPKLTPKKKVKAAAKKRTKILKHSKVLNSTAVHSRNSTKAKHRSRRSAEPVPPNANVLDSMNSMDSMEKMEKMNGMDKKLNSTKSKHRSRRSAETVPPPVNVYDNPPQGISTGLDSMNSMDSMDKMDKMNGMNKTLNSTKSKHRSRRSADAHPKKETVKKLRLEKVKEQKGDRKNSIVIHRPPIIYHPPPEIYHRPDIVVHRAPIMLHRPSIIYHQPPVVVHRPAIIYHQPSIVFHQPPPVVHQPIVHSHDNYVTRPVVLHTASSVSHASNYLGIPEHVYSDYEDGHGGFHGDFHNDYHGGFHGDAFRKHSVPRNVKTVRAEIQGKIFKKSKTDHEDSSFRSKRDIYTRYLDNLDYLSQYWKPKAKRHVEDEFDVISSKAAASEALTYNDVKSGILDKRDEIPRYYSSVIQKRDNEAASRNKRGIDYDDNDLADDDDGAFIQRKKKKDVVVNRPPIIYHPPPEVYHRPDIVVHRPPLVIHRPPIIYHQPPVIVHRPAVVYHQPPIVFHQPPPAVSQPLLFSHDSYRIHPSFYATHHGSVVRDYGHYIGIPNIVSNYGAPLFHSAMAKRSKISKPSKKKSTKKTSTEKPNKKSKLNHKKSSTENPHKKNSVVIRRPPIIYHPPPEIYHRPDIVVHRAPIMIHRAPIIYHQPPVVVHRPAIVYHQPSLVFHQPPPAVHQPLIESHDTWVTHSVPVPFSSHVTRQTAYVGIPKHSYMNLHDHWGGDSHGHAYFKSEVPKNEKGEQRDKISKGKKHTIKKSLKHKHVKEEKAKRKNSVMVKRPPIIYHPPPEIFHRPDIVVHRPPILVNRAPIVYHQPPVIVHRPAIVYHQPSVVFHQPLPMVHQPIMKSHDTWVTRPSAKLYGSTMHHLGAVTQYPNVYYHGHNHLNYMAYGKSKVPKKEEKPSARDEIKHEKASDHEEEDLDGSGEDDDDDDDNDELVESGSGSGYGDLDIEVVPEDTNKSKFQKSKPRTESAMKKDKISKISKEKQKEVTEKGSKKNSVVIHRPPIIYHPPPEIYHRPDIVVHRAPIVLYRAPIIYHQPPVVVHRPAIVYHQPSIVFHQPPPMVHQPIMHSHDNYVTHSVAVPVGSHVSPVEHYHGVPHEEIYMEGIGHGAFAKSMLPLQKGHKRDKIKGENVAKAKDSQKATKRSRRALDEDEDYLLPRDAESLLDDHQPIGAGERIRRAVEQSWISNLDSSSMHAKELSKRNKESVKKGKSGKMKKKDVVVSRPPIIYHPPPEVYHRPEIIVHRAPILIHRPPIVYHQPPVVVHRPAVVYHQPPIVFHQPPPSVNQPMLFSHDQYILHPTSIAQHINSVVNEGGHYIGIPHGGIENYPGPLDGRPFGHVLPPFAQYRVMKRSKVQRLNDKDLEKENKENKEDEEEDEDEGSGAGSGNGKIPSRRSKAQTSKPSKGERKNNVVIYRPPMIYHPPPEIYDRPNVVVHRPDLVIHRPSIVYHQPSVVIHRPPIVYQQPPVVFHQPPPLNHQPILKSHDTYVAHQYLEPHSSAIHHAGSYMGAPHFYPGVNAYGWGMQPYGSTYHGPVAAGPGFGLPFGSAFGRSTVEKTSKKKSHRHHHKDVKRHANHIFDPVHTLMELHESFVTDPSLQSYQGENSPVFRSVYTKSKVAAKRESKRSTKKRKGGRKLGQKNVDKKNLVIANRPPMIYHPPPEIYDRPDVVVHRPDIVIHRPSVVYHQPSVVVHRPPIIYHEPPVVFHQPPPMVHNPIIHSHDTYINHPFYEPYGSHIEHTGTYAGAPHFFGGGFGYGYGGVGPAFGKSKVEKDTKPKNDTKKRSRRSIKKQKKASKTGSKKNMVLIQRPPMIYHPPPEIYDRPNVVVHRPDLVIHRPSIVYHQPSVVLHRPPVIYQQPPVVFHQPPPLNTQPVMHAYDSYVAHTYHEPVASSLYHAGTYVGAPHYYPGGWGVAPHAWGPAFGKSKVPKAKNKGMKVKRSTTSGAKKSNGKGDKKNVVIANRPPMIYHPPPEIYDRPDVVVHRPDIVIHRPSVVYHQPSVVVHRPPIIYHEPPVVFHQPSPMVHHPIIHSHDTYINHPFYEPYGSHIEHTGTYAGAPHFFGGGFGYGYGGNGPAFGKSKVVKSPKKTSKAKKSSKVAKQRSNRDVEDKSKKIEKKTKTTNMGAAPGHKKNVVVMRRPPVVYHPPPEVYHRPDVILHRPDIVIHRPSVVFHQSAVVLHRPAVVYHQPPIVFHQPTPMVHQPIIHSHETYLPHHYYEPAAAHVRHAGTYVGAPHFYHGGWGWGYGNHAGHAFGKSKVEDIANGKASKKMKLSQNMNKKNDDDDKDDDDDDDGDGDDDEDDDDAKITKSKDKSRRSLKSHKNLKVVDGHKKNIVVMRRPPVVYHPPPEVYHRPDVVLHRPDIVIHRPSVVFHQAPVLLHRPSVVYHQPPIVFHQPTPMVNQPIINSHETYLPHHFYEPFHSHVVHAGTYVGAPHFYGGGWGWGYGHGHGHAFGKSKVEKKKKSHRHKTKRNAFKDNKNKHAAFKMFLQRRSIKGSKKDLHAYSSHKGSKTTARGAKKNMVLIQRPPMIYHPPPEIYDRPNIVVHRPDLVYHQPSIVYHQSSVVVHRAPVIYHQPPVVFHQPSPLVHQDVLHSHDRYLAHQYFEPVASHVQHEQTYVGAPHFFGGGWGYGLGQPGPLMHPSGPWNGLTSGQGFHRYGPTQVNPYGFGGVQRFTPQAAGHFGPAFAKSEVERASKEKALRKSHKSAAEKHGKRTRKTRSLSTEDKKSTRVKSHSRHHKGLRKNVVVMNRAPIMFHSPPEVYHRPDVVIHRPDILIHRPPIVVHQPAVVVHKPAVLYHQSPVVFHQPPPFVHQPVMYSHDTYVPHTYNEPFGAEVAHAGSYVGAPHAFPGGWGYGYGHVVGGFGKSKVEKTTSSKDKKAHKRTKSKTVRKQEKATKKVNILHAEVEKDVKADKKNDIVVNRPPIIYHPPPEVYHRPDIVVHRAPIVVHRPPIIYHQPPVVVHRPAVVYHQPPIVFHQPPPAVHQPIIHSHDTFVVHHSAMYEPHGSTVSHETNYIGIPSHVEHFDDGFDFHGGHGVDHSDFGGNYHGDYHGDYHGGYHGDNHGDNHGGYHGGYHGNHGGYMLHRSNIEHAKKTGKVSSRSSTKSTISKTEAPVKRENTHTDITDDDQQGKTITKRQILGSHSLFLPVSPLNVAHPKGPIVERLQKMSTIPGVPGFDYERDVAKRDLDSEKKKRQLLFNPSSFQTPLNYGNLNALTPQRVIHPEEQFAQAQYAPLVPAAQAMYPRPFAQPLLQNPLFSSYLPAKPPGVNVHVETQRSKIPDRREKKKLRQRRQVLPGMQPGMFGAVPHLPFYNQAPVTPFFHAPDPQVPLQQYFGYHPMTLPSYPFMNFQTQRRPHVNINVQSIRSNIPTKRNKKSKTKRRNKRQLFPQVINPYALASNSPVRDYGPFSGFRPYNPYWNRNPLFFRQTPDIPHDEDEDASDPESQRVEFIKQYLTNLYEYYTGERFNHRRPKVDVEVHASKSNIPGSSPRDIIIRSRRQLLSYLPQSPLTTGRYDIPISGPLSSFVPSKRNKVRKPKRSTGKNVDKKTKVTGQKGVNSKRDEFTTQSEGKNQESNSPMNPDNPGALPFGNAQNDQFPAVNAGAEGLNEIGPGRLNGATVEPQRQQEQNQQGFVRQQQELPRFLSEANNGARNPDFAQFQEMQANNRMSMPLNEEQMLRLRGQTPFFFPGPQLPFVQKTVFGPVQGPAAFFPSAPEVLPNPVPMMRPFAPFPFDPLLVQQPPLPSPLQMPIEPFAPEQSQETINVNVNTAKSKLPGVKPKKKTEESKNTEKHVLPAEDNHKNGDKRQKISLFQRVPAMQVLPQRFLQNGVIVPSFSNSEQQKESQIHGVNGMIISELQVQRKYAIPSKVKTKNKQAATKKSSSNAAMYSKKTEVKPKKFKRQIYGMNELPQGMKFSELSKDENNSKKFQIRKDEEKGLHKTEKDQKRHIELIKRNSGARASYGAKVKGGGKKPQSTHAKNPKVVHSHHSATHVRKSKKKSPLSKLKTLVPRKRQFVMPFGVGRAQVGGQNLGFEAGQGVQGFYGGNPGQVVQNVPQVINQYQQVPQQVGQVDWPQQTQESSFADSVQRLAQFEEPLNHFQSFANNDFSRLGEAERTVLGRRPKVSVSVQVAKSSIGKGTKETKTKHNSKAKTITKRQLFGTVALLSPLGRADVNTIVKSFDGRSRVTESQTKKDRKDKRQVYNAPQPLGVMNSFQPVQGVYQPRRLPQQYQYYGAEDPYQQSPKVNINVRTARSSIENHPNPKKREANGDTSRQQSLAVQAIAKKTQE